MKSRILLSVLFSLMMLSCGIHEIGGDGVYSGSGSIWGSPPGSLGESDSFSSVCYMTALDYKKGYDWRSDQACESVKCSLVVYADGVPVMKVPAGQMYEVSADPDMHRIIKGHLYTDYSTDSETVIKKNGAQLFRYKGRESMCGMEVIGEDVYTLGQSREGGGFALRKNGEVILHREEGNVIGGLVNDDDSLCFAFSEQIRNADGPVGRYYTVVNGKVSQVAVREDIKTVWDVLAGKDGAVYVASLIGLSLPVIFKGASMSTLPMPSGASLLSCRLFNLAGNIVAEGSYRTSEGICNSAVWIEGRMIPNLPQRMAISAACLHEEGVSCAMNPSYPSGQGIIYRCGEVYEMPPGYTVIGSSCMRMIDGILHVGMSSMDGQKPLLWKDGQADSLDINGYIATIYPG